MKLLISTSLLWILTGCTATKPVSDPSLYRGADYEVVDTATRERLYLVCSSSDGTLVFSIIHQSQLGTAAENEGRRAPLQNIDELLRLGQPGKTLGWLVAPQMELPPHVIKRVVSAGKRHKIRICLLYRLL